MARKTLFHIFAESCDGGDGSWAGYLHAGLMFLFTGLELQSCRGMPPVQRGRDGSDESKQRIIYLQRPVGAQGCQKSEDRGQASKFLMSGPGHQESRERWRLGLRLDNNQNWKNLTVNIYH